MNIEIQSLQRATRKLRNDLARVTLLALVANAISVVALGLAIWALIV